MVEKNLQPSWILPQTVSHLNKTPMPLFSENGIAISITITMTKLLMRDEREQPRRTPLLVRKLDQTRLRVFAYIDWMSETDLPGPSYFTVSHLGVLIRSIVHPFSS